jgi:hypothetical protein
VVSPNQVKEQYLLSAMKGTNDELVSAQEHDVTNVRTEKKTKTITTMVE